MAHVFLGLGTNIGNRLDNINLAIKLLRNEGLKVEKLSKIIETKPVGGPPQPKFLNAVASIRTNFKPKTLLKKIKSIERKMGRSKGVRFGPRIIDLDILLYDDLILKTKTLEIPHPRMFERIFVLRPLSSLISAARLRELKKQFKS